ncbi:cysteine-rich motor neuron 1 protein-like isoform X2 [Ostrea edulis]|uniref:cysteine-rich motor neuron 1 protein-like isoform X2 n=1 Tax=Ostrea edulis TaxID=37623 RepID=UPI0024AEFA79|nr:cysteine-rich motor neuron 1 protein-like isoform X2 [Ostrea edulis]
MRSSPRRGAGDCRLLVIGIVKHVLALSLILFVMCISHAGVDALKCTPCNLSACPDPPTDCPRGTILDVCGCCQVCGKDINETCGGPFEILGKCGDGLECALTSEVGDPITGSEKGVCREKCQSVVCPWIQDFRPDCPADSHLLPSIQSKDGCCLQPPGCECDKCSPELCPSGLRVQVLEEGTGTPGQCCSKYRCVNETDLNCHVDLTGTLETYTDGQSWKPDKCVKCTCKRGLTFCKQQSCHNITICPYMESTEGDCCPVCKGCMTGSGDVVHNNSTWQESDCTVCTCVNGKAECKSMLCETRCSKPRKVPGQCCPVCDEDDSSRQSDQCPDLHQCSLDCPNGFQFNKDSCYMCKCKPANCYLDCLEGYKKNSDGVEVCECAKPHSICPVMEDCKKQCTYGLKVSRNGCQKCSCNKCPAFSCSKKCAHDYMKNEQGCKLCKCKGKSRHENTPSLFDVKHTEKSCLSVDGQYHENGDSWHDGCRLCYCYGGQEMCALISCPRPSCSTPVFRLGDCCPSCPGNVILPKSKGTREMCESLDGRYFVEGESWHLDNCTQCLCHNGSILCETHACPPLLCSYPTILHNACCPVCQGQEEDKSLQISNLPSKRTCRTDTGYTYNDGDVWKSNPCQSCTCSSGQVHCFSQVCPSVTCSKSVLRKGSCCPTCLDFSHQKICTDNGITYALGEQWLKNNCTKCYCIDGKVTCLELPCPTMSCKYMVNMPGECCPVCVDETTTVEVRSLSEPDPSDIVKVEAERGPEESDRDATTIIICVLAAMVILLVILFVLYFVFKFAKRRSESKKYSPKGADIENIQPVQVKLLGYETSEKPVKNSQQRWNADLLPVPKLSDEEKHVNLLSKAFDKTNCVKFDDGIY